MSHHIIVCQHGQIHGQCRCPSSQKEVRRVTCTIVGHQGLEPEVNPHLSSIDMTKLNRPTHDEVTPESDTADGLAEQALAIQATIQSAQPTKFNKDMLVLDTVSQMATMLYMREIRDLLRDR